VFVRKKTKPQGSSAYYQLVESRRVDGKPRQKVILHLNHYPTVDEALKGWPRDAFSLRRRGYQEAAEEVRTKLARLKELRAEGIV
jgi:hypothetical protein